MFCNPLLGELWKFPFMKANIFCSGITHDQETIQTNLSNIIASSCLPVLETHHKGIRDKEEDEFLVLLKHLKLCELLWGAAVFWVHYKTPVILTRCYMGAIGICWKDIHVSPEQKLRCHPPNIQPFIGLISGAALTAPYPVAANVILNSQAINCNNGSLKYLQQNTEYFECHHRRNNLTKISLGI